MIESPMRRLPIVLLLAAALLGAAVAQAQSVTVRPVSVEAPAGQVAEVPIMVEGSPGIAAMHLELTYDPDILAVESVEAGSLMVGNALAAFNADEPGRVIISLAAAGNVAGDGDLAVARFMVNGEAGQTSALNLEYPEAWDESGFDVQVNAEVGQFTVGSAGLPPWLLAVLGALLLLVFLLLLLIARRRRPTPEPVAAYPPQVAPVQPQQAPPKDEPAPGRKFCGNCGQRLEPGKRFCVHCGHPVPAAPEGNVANAS
jgi:hypothetical protein